ncbi:membrane steroid-binding protein 2-like [Magnolia sinica]|uniref:membrane steroid-binding protein 2-like n=1 Tax=Magnolia sinica TaxID=86752 RepID=UPI00265B402E|nr:membrane steroid-binding protein 2-like [Magnolia sinica]
MATLVSTVDLVSTIDQLWATLKDSITAYTGLSPTTFFTVLALGMAFYYAVSNFFDSPPPPRRSRDYEVKMEPLPPQVQLGEITEEELKVYDGSDPKKPLLMAIKGLPLLVNLRFSGICIENVILMLKLRIIMESPIWQLDLGFEFKIPN